MNPSISIIIATYNASKTLPECLSSIHGQKYRNFEVIIVDGASTDNTIDIIKNHGSLVAKFVSQKDSGIYEAWNTGLKLATGNYICFIGADDYFHDNESLSHLAEALSEEKYDLVTSMGLFLGPGNKNHIIGKSWNFKSLQKRITICHPGLMHHRSLFSKYGEFDASLRIVGDYEFLLRLPESIKSKHVAIPTVCIRDGGISRSRLSLMLTEKRQVQSICPRIGPAKAWFNYFDKLWRIPVARILGISY
jgi:glycosyltransferase involved in cell wall biosynthesis